MGDLTRRPAIVAEFQDVLTIGIPDDRDAVLSIVGVFDSRQR